MVAQQAPGLVCPWTLAVKISKELSFIRTFTVLNMAHFTGKIIGLSYERPYLVLDLNSIMICMFSACVIRQFTPVNQQFTSAIWQFTPVNQWFTLVNHRFTLEKYLISGLQLLFS